VKKSEKARAFFSFLFFFSSNGHFSVTPLYLSKSTSSSPFSAITIYTSSINPTPIFDLIFIFFSPSPSFFSLSSFYLFE